MISFPIDFFIQLLEEIAAGRATNISSDDWSTADLWALAGHLNMLNGKVIDELAFRSEMLKADTEKSEGEAEG